MVGSPTYECFGVSVNATCQGMSGSFSSCANFRQHNAFEQAELILQAALDPAVASRARKGELVKCFDHFDLLQTARN